MKASHLVDFRSLLCAAISELAYSPACPLQTLGVTIQLLKLVLLAQLAAILGSSSNISPLWQVRQCSSSCDKLAGSFCWPCLA